MAKTPSLESEIEKARAAIGDTRAAEASLLQQISTLFGADDADASHDKERQALDAVIVRYDEVEKALANLTLYLSGDIEKCFERFDAASERTRYENFLAFFSRNKATKRQAERVKTFAIAETLKRLLFLSDDVAVLLSDEKTAASKLHETCEAPLRAIMEKRRTSSAEIEAGRQRLKEINALLATAQWKLGSVTDDKRRASLEAERESLSLELEEQEKSYQLLRARHQRLEEQILLQESLSQSATQRLSAHAMLYNMLSLAMERAIQLYGAVTMTLDGLMREITENDASPRPHLLDLIKIHAHNAITLDDIDKRKQPVTEAFARRYRIERSRVVAIEGRGR
ncbi:hypothetical protein [Agrobacterium larrymoorei]|uniref:DUF2326 domain-containing protein n=1 Tax=Agrobacterium larrymoorei TaxID=160699 RepID=A0ABU0UNZ9_9HYPH|nr:hypothetical protein [Agrobacterium larrymoorei]MDQ1186667.1 hypothetical protein [Agrobacterium larrymoorei]